MDSRPSTDVLVVGAFVGVLKAAPAADIVDKDDIEIGIARLHIVNELLKCLSAVYTQTALAVVRIGPNDLKVAAFRVFSDGVALVLRRILLMLCGHPDVLCRPQRNGRHIT